MLVFEVMLWFLFFQSDFTRCDSTQSWTRCFTEKERSGYELGVEESVQELERYQRAEGDTRGTGDKTVG